jgi:hypothetical protein
MRIVYGLENRLASGKSASAPSSAQVVMPRHVSYNSPKFAHNGAHAYLTLPTHIRKSDK